MKGALVTFLETSCDLGGQVLMKKIKSELICNNFYTAVPFKKLTESLMEWAIILFNCIE